MYRNSGRPLRGVSVIPFGIDLRFVQLLPLECSEPLDNSLWLLTAFSRTDDAKRVIAEMERQHRANRDWREARLWVGGSCQYWTTFSIVCLAKRPTIVVEWWCIALYSQHGHRLGRPDFSDIFATENSMFFAILGISSWKHEFSRFLPLKIALKV